MSTSTLPVIEDHIFAGSNKGLITPVRHVLDGGFGLKIVNLDRADPPQYTPDSVPRSLTFNANVLGLTIDPTMPVIKLECEVLGFTPSATTPIFWRLQTLHVPARFFNRGRSRYISKVVPLEDEWTGKSESSHFDLFAAGSIPSGLIYDNRDDRVAGGHAILTVAARPDPNRAWLQDFVHLRITGSNPTNQKIRQFVKTIVAHRNAAPFEPMLNAIFAWEARGLQFSERRQTQTHYNTVLFDWPDDPADFPLTAFDFGVGISQFTSPSSLKTAYAWDWRGNVSAGVNVFFEKLRRTYSPGMRWSEWALAAWEAYNGTGSASKEYADRLAASPDGKTVSTNPVPNGFDLAAATAAIEFPKPPPGKWPVTKASAREIATAVQTEFTIDLAAEQIASAASRVAGDPETLAWMWPRVASDLHAQRDRIATNVLPGLNGAEVASAVAGLDKSGVEHLSNTAFSLAWRRTSEMARPLAAVARIGGGPIDQEFQTLSPFVRQHIGERGTVAEWAAIRDLMLTAFGAPTSAHLAITRINAYYNAFVPGQLRPGGASMRVHAQMKGRMDATFSLLATKGVDGRLGDVAEIGGFAIRRNANNHSVLSNHSFGIAMDLDASLNPNMSMRTAALDAWKDLVLFLTGVAPYGSESTRLRSARSYDQSLDDVQVLRKASTDYVLANKNLANLAAAVVKGVGRIAGTVITVSDAESLLILAAPPHPNETALRAKLTALGVASGKKLAMTARLIFAREVFAAAQNRALKPAITGTATTTAKFGFINLSAEVICGLIASDGGKLRWLGTSNSTKDYMHFDFPDNQHPPLF